MTTGIEFNKNYASSYIIMPLPKIKTENGQTMTVRCADKDLESKINAKNSMQNLDELRQADSDGNGILTLKEIKNCKNKSEFMEKLEQAMIKFNSNPSRDYAKNLFEDWV